MEVFAATYTTDEAPICQANSQAPANSLYGFFGCKHPCKSLHTV
ncbi:hypothetical protein SAMN04487964_11553 [Marinobacterium sediminicola]|uniref:Uncharacterized protein n=1 Tax=Marinobacterium sediminicola TaxID=518898 RepID=A0ABY1S2Z4_9GAMM|nr:hypothetical protein SAMN04487964_11553 [Marinobacterium sediminicola]